MQALGPGLPLLAPAPVITGQAQAFPGQDLFQALLQGRMVAQAQPLAEPLQVLAGGAALKVSWKTPFSPSAQKLNLLPNSSQANGCLAERTAPWAPVPAPALGGIRPGLPRVRVIPPQRLAELAACLTQAGVAPEQVQALLADPQVKERGLTLEELKNFWRTSGLAEQAGDLPDPDLPPALKELAAYLEEAPGRTLPLPPGRQPEVAALLLAAGLPPEEVERLLTSPRVQDEGLALKDLKASWQRSQREDAPQEGFLGLTSRADYQRQWERLNLPLSALPDVRLALQQLGAIPEQLAALEDKATPQGLPVGQVWRVLKEMQTRVTPESPAGPQASPAPEPAPAPRVSDSTQPAPPAAPMPEASPLRVGIEEVEGWRQLLIKAGMPPETAAAILGGEAPVSREELKSRLLAAAPTAPPPAAQEVPKPLYLPENLRLRSLNWQNPQDRNPGAGQGQGEARHQVLEGPGKAADHSAAAPGSQEALTPFASLLAGDGSPNPHPASLSSGSEAPAAALWSKPGPELREALWPQINEGCLTALRHGESQVRLTLDPPELGHLKLTLHLKGQELEVVAVASRPEAAELARGGMEHLVQALSQQGLMLTQFTVHLESAPGRPALAELPGPRPGRREETPEAGKSRSELRPSRVDCFA